MKPEDKHIFIRDDGFYDFYDESQLPFGGKYATEEEAKKAMLIYNYEFLEGVSAPDETKD